MLQVSGWLSIKSPANSELTEYYCNNTHGEYTIQVLFSVMYYFSDLY